MEHTAPPSNLRMKTVKKSPAGAAASGSLTAAEAMLPMAAETEKHAAADGAGC